jgi:hypothetical protein
LYWTTPSRLLYEAAHAQARLGVGLVRGAAGAGRAAFAPALARSALLSARLAFFDLGRPAVAARCHDVALAASAEAGDHALAAAVLGHMAFLPAGRDPEGARNLASAALRHTDYDVSPLVRSWLHCVLSEIDARAGAAPAARRQVDAAESALRDDHGHPPPTWFDFYDAGRFEAFAGYAALAAGELPEAARRLAGALDAIGPRGAKQRSVIFADLAAAGADDDRAADCLDQAVGVLRADWYQTGLDRVRAARPRLGDGLRGRRLDEQIEALAAARPARGPG